MRVVIVGGGVMGAATAFFLAREHAAQVTVIERDPAYRMASSSLSASSIRMQFSTPVNIALSQASLAFYRTIGHELMVDGVAPDIGLTEPGYLFLATTAGADTLRANRAIQAAHGAQVDLLAPADLAARFPWLAVDDIALGAHGRSDARSGEGWFDGYSVLTALRRKAGALGVQFVTGEVVDLGSTPAPYARTAQGDRLQGDALVIAAGCWSAPLARCAGVELPVRARKRDVFVFDSPAATPQCPLVIDPSGLWFRPEGRGYLCGAPPRGADLDDLPLSDIDHALFDDVLWPALARRVPGFEALRRTQAWAGYYEMNTFDQNGLVGRLPGQQQVFTACGFSGHGMQQAPAVGRALAELIATGGYRTLDLTPLAPQRVLDGTPLAERNVI
jgi:FAD-dependent oxidoreductase domain-containing protein 1